MEKADQADIESIKKKQKTMTTIKPSLNYAHTRARANKVGPSKMMGGGVKLLI